MRYPAFLLACLFVFHVVSFTVAQDRTANQANQGKEVEVVFPDDIKTPILTLDVVGGFRAKLPEGFEPTPMLQVFADGRVVTGRKSDLVKEVEGKLDLVELKSLLVFIADDCKFFELDSESLKTDIESKRAIQLMDAGTTKIEVNLQDNSNAVEVYAMPQAANQFSELPSVASMIAISSRCRQLIAKTRLGSDEEAEAALNAANKSLATKSDDAPEFTMKHLQFAEQFVDQRRTATFVNNFAAGDKQMMAYATFQVDAKGKDSVVVDVIERKQHFGRRK
jgi:hypothetical protein